MKYTYLFMIVFGIMMSVITYYLIDKIKKLTMYIKELEKKVNSSEELIATKASLEEVSAQVDERFDEFIRTIELRDNTIKLYLDENLVKDINLKGQFTQDYFYEDGYLKYAEQYNNRKEWVTLEYDDNNSLVKQCVYDEDSEKIKLQLNYFNGQVKDKLIYEYSEDKVKIAKEIYDISGRRIDTEYYDYAV